MRNALSRRHRAGSRKNKRNRDVGTRPSDSVVTPDRRIGQLRPHAPQEVRPTRMTIVQSFEDMDRIMSTEFLGALDHVMKDYEPGLEMVFERDDQLSAAAIRARISRAAKKHGRKVSVSLQGTYLTVVLGK